MDDNFVLRSGKHAGKTIGWLRTNDSGYLNWVSINQPNMLKPLKSIQPKNSEDNTTNKRVQPNMNFDNEGPDPILKSKTNGN